MRDEAGIEIVKENSEDSGSGAEEGIDGGFERMEVDIEMILKVLGVKFPSINTVGKLS